MNQQALESQFLYSSLGSDPDLGELVEMFVDEMPERVSSLNECAQGSDWEGLGRLAHQVKGAAGSYGFEQITPYAAKLEQQCRSESTEAEILASCEQLVSLLQKTRAGAPQ